MSPNKYGCWNRAPLRTQVIVQSGWWMDGVSRTARMVSIPDPMTKDCQYSKDKTDDAGCIGCKHKSQPKEAHA